MSVAARRGVALAWCAVALGAAACDGGPRATLTTDATTYTARLVSGTQPLRRYELTIVTRLENHTGGTIFLDRCTLDARYPIYGVELDGGGESAFDPGWGCPGVPPFELPDGEARVDTLTLHGPNAMEGGTTTYLGQLAGRHRVLMGRVRSNALEIRLPE